MDAHFATFKDTPMGLNDDEEPYALYVEGRVGRFSKREPKNVDLQFQVNIKKLRNSLTSEIFREINSLGNYLVKCSFLEMFVKKA